MDTKVVDQCHISPSHAAAAAATEQSLPLLYFDMAWLPVHHMQTLYFYNFPSSKPHFFNTILPNLKNSLSLALKHFLPLAGNITFPLNSGMPFSHYSSTENHSVSLTVAVSDSDFFLLTGNNPKDADDFHDFIPEIPAAVYSSEAIKFPVFALQITLFPSQGICIGVANHHAVCDGASIVRFLQTWASINKFDDEKHLLALGSKILPDHNRTAVEGSDRLTPVFWEMMKNSRPTVSSAVSFPTHKLRGTFLLSDQEISKLKNFVASKKPGLAHVSSLAVVCARIWSCLAAATGEGVGDDEAEYLSMPADCRARLRPPLPSSYFGNCLVLVLAESTHGRLRGHGGFVAAVEAIGEALHKTLKNEKGILDRCVERYVEYVKLNGKRVVGITGSPRFELFGRIDYGWGGMKKAEALHIDVTGSVCLYKTKDGIEVGISLPRTQMNAFASIFNKNVYEVLQGSKL